MDQKTIAFARRRARRYVGEHHPHGLDEEDVENMILRRLHYNKDKGERGQKAALALALNEAQNEGRRNFRSLVPWQMRRGMSAAEVARDMYAISSRQRVRERDRIAVRRTVVQLSPEDRRMAELYMKLLNWKKVAAATTMWTHFRMRTIPSCYLATTRGGHER